MIESISFLISDTERKHIKSKNGRFPLNKDVKSKLKRKDTKEFSAKGFVQYVKKNDPYITLKDGTKMRVYRGGDPSDEVIETISIIESHDKQMKKVLVPEYPDFSDYFDY